VSSTQPLTTLGSVTSLFKAIHYLSRKSCYESQALEYCINWEIFTPKWHLVLQVLQNHLLN